MAVTQELINDIKKQLEGLSPEEQQKKLEEILSKLPPEDREALIGKQECPFCLMIQGKIPVKTVYEDDKVLAILDINPATKGHTLLFPKVHAQFLPQLDDDMTAHIFKVANKLSDALFQSLNATGTNILVSNGQGAGQVSPHILINIIPRYDNDNVSFRWNPLKVDETELDELQKKINEKTKEIKIKKSEEKIVINTAPEKSESNFLDELPIP